MKGKKTSQPLASIRIGCSLTDNEVSRRRTPKIPKTARGSVAVGKSREENYVPGQRGATSPKKSMQVLDKEIDPTAIARGL